MNDIYIRRVTLPANIKGATVKDSDDNFNVYINEQLCPKAMQATINHEMCHIMRNHFYNEQTAMQLEDDVDA